MSSPPEHPEPADQSPAGPTSPTPRSRGPAPEPRSRPDNPVLSAGRFASDQTGATVVAYLLTGPALFGGLGWLADQWLGTGFIALIGVLAGMAMSLYVIWLRYGTQ